MDNELWPYEDRDVEYDLMSLPARELDITPETFAPCSNEWRKATAKVMQRLAEAFPGQVEVEIVWAEDEPT